VKRRGRALLTLGLFAAVGVAGCGTVSAGPPIAPPPPTASVPAAPTSGHSQIAGKSATQILRASADALDGVHSFEIDAHGRDTSGARILLSGVFVMSPGPDQALSLIVADGPSAASIRVVGGYGYIVANTPFWVHSGMTAQQAQPVAGRWLRIPTARVPGLSSMRDWLSPATAGRCILGTDGSVATLGGHSQVNGISAVVLKDRGRHGGALGDVYVSASGAPLPLRVTQTVSDSGTTPPDRACGDTVNSSQGAFGATKSMTMTFGHWNEATSISPPPGQFTSLSGGSMT
jgi:hypothetical protein